VHPGDDQYQFVRDVRASLGRPRRLDRFGDAVVFVFLWFWCSWMSFGLWALAMKVAYGNPVEEGEPSGPWPLRLYLGIPVAAASPGLLSSSALAASAGFGSSESNRLETKSEKRTSLARTRARYQVASG